MRKYVLALVLLNLVFLTNCGRLKQTNTDKVEVSTSSEYKLVGDQIVKLDRDDSSNSSKASYELIGDKIVKIEKPNIKYKESEPLSLKVAKADEKKFVTSAPIFTVKKDVEPFVTSKPMFMLKNKEARKNPKLFDMSFESGKKFWLTEIMPKMPDGYNVNRYTLAEEERKKAEAAAAANPDYAGGKIGEGEITAAYEDIYYEDPSKSDDVDAGNDIVGIDGNTLEKQLSQVPGDGDLSEEYKNMLGDDAGKYEIVDDISKVNGDVADRLFFAHGSAKISASDENKIKKISENLSSLDSDYKLSVVGHASTRVDGVTDPKLKKEINFKMAKQRADKVTNEFKKNGIDSKTILAVSKGDEEPNPEPGNKTQEEADRRVDVFLDAEDYYY